MRLFNIPIEAIMAMTEVQKAYIAGFFDGEGCVSIYYNSKIAPKPMCKVSITQNRPAVLKWIASIFTGGYRIYPRTAVTPGGTTYRQNNLYEWSLNGVSGPRAFLSVIRPYMIVKAEETDEALFVINNRDSMSREEVMQTKERMVNLRVVKESA